MKLLLTHGYFLSEDLKEQQIMRPYPPLGILYLSAHLGAKGFSVDIYDSTFGTREELYRILDEQPPGAVGIYANLITRSSALAIAARAHASGWRVILGGPEPANYPEEYLGHGADVIVCGEGEFALEQLAASDFAPTAWSSIKGLAFRNAQGQLVSTGPAELIPNLDALPWPDREKIDIPQYLRTWREHHGSSALSMITARGCPYKCNWCSHSVYGQTHRRRSPGAVADEVEFLLKRYEPDTLWMADDVFTIHHGWLFQYARELKTRGIRIPFECITRADRMSPQVAEVLAELGCARIWIGSESGSQKILDAMQRGVKVEQVQQAVALCKQHGIQTGMFLMWGYDGEEISDIEATVDHVKRCRPDTFLTTVSYPIKGTPYFERLSDRLVNLKPWGATTDREWSIRGRHSRRFYQHADALLRSAMAPEPDHQQILAARSGLAESFAEVEA